MAKYFLIALTSLILSACQTKPDTIDINIKGQTFTLQVAKTVSQKSKGLSNRDSLCKNCGMIFVYQKESIYPFWMKNTHFPLDIFWLDKNGQVVDKKTGQANDPTVLTPSTPAQFIIELPASSTSLSIGDTINITKL